MFVNEMSCLKYMTVNLNCLEGFYNIISCKVNVSITIVYFTKYHLLNNHTMNVNVTLTIHA